jgi:hypothetical protein
LDGNFKLNQTTMIEYTVTQKTDPMFCYFDFEMTYLYEYFRYENKYFFI